MIEWLGRFHPLLVHLPIGFIVLLAILEWLALRPQWKELNAATRVILALNIPASVASVVCGWLLALDGSYESGALFWHRWLGTGVAVACLILWMLRQRGWQSGYRRSVWATVVLLAIASHFGGSLTHGDSFLSWPKQKTSVEENGQVDRTTQPVYSAVVQPIMDKYCVQCHGPKKTKGKLQLDTFENLSKGGDSGEVVVRGDSEKSLLIKRLLLPVDTDEHMPPEAKPQPTQNEVELLRWWIDSGAAMNKTAAELKAPETILRLLKP